MRKYLCFFLLVFWGISCQKVKNEIPVNESQQTEVAVSIDEKQDLPNFSGIYKGVLPCADCQGMETEITLEKGNFFIKKTKYLGKDDEKFMEEKGIFSLDEAGNTIILEGIKDAPNQYLIGENTITQLDMSGKQIEGALSEHYILKK